MKQNEETIALAEKAKNTVKKVYRRPQLTEYGNITTLTQAMMMGSFADMMGGFMMLP